MTALTAALVSASSVTSELEIEFPNLFGGLAINYFRGFEIFGVSIYWYGVLITVGVILAYLYAMCRTKDFGLSKDRVFDVVFAALIGGFLGARVYYCVFQTLDPNSGVDYNFITVFTTIRDGGLAIYGGIIGGFLVGFVACKIRKVKFTAMCDLASLGFLIGQTIGRWGNFINQEAFGSVCSPDFIFGMTGTVISRQVEPAALVHPCFLYESVWCLLGFVGLHFYSKKLRTFDGEVALLYVAWYGLGRAFIEGLRTDSLMIGEYRVSQLLAAVSFAAALILFIAFKIVTEKKGIPLYVNTEECAALLKADREAEDAANERRAAKKAEREKAAPSILADEDEESAAGEESPSGEESTAAEESAADGDKGSIDKDMESPDKKNTTEDKGSTPEDEKNTPEDKVSTPDNGENNSANEGEKSSPEGETTLPADNTAEAKPDTDDEKEQNKPDKESEE